MTLIIILRIFKTLFFLATLPFRLGVWLGKALFVKGQ